MKLSLLLVITTLFVAGCSNTWEGVKEDSSKVWEDTKETVHEATE
ncbi:entericidin EcnAB [Salinivibrio sp. ML198]|nr:MULTISPECIES: entericidin EcnAB [unclassified Salinivibrio]OOE74657.1 entericidin EcnAB [Salinivibrio sp. ML290]OOE78010.1 entericidin EcnAB [Salinivibrio sp. ML198]